MKSELCSQNGSILAAQKCSRTPLQSGSVLVCSSGVYFGIHIHSHGTCQQVQQMQLVAMDICPAFNFEDVLGYLKNKDVVWCFDFTMIANYFFYPWFSLYCFAASLLFILLKGETMEILWFENISNGCSLLKVPFMWMRALAELN